MNNWHSLSAGQQVEVEGWACPFEPADAHDYFALIPHAPCCIGCIPRDPAGRIEVFAAAPVPASGLKLRLRGEWRITGGDGWRYQLRNARSIAATPFPRRTFLRAAPLVCVAAAGDDARQVIADAPTVDVHSHAGRITGVRTVRENLPFAPLADPMRAGGMAAICLAAVSDAPTHRVMADHRIHPFRDPAPGELYAYAQLSFARIHALAQAQNISLITDAAALAAARGGKPSAIVAAEGGDFLEGIADRVDEAYAKWQLRHLQLTHYRVNELGDIQTEAPVHGGLTDAGVEVIRRCNRRGLVVDVAHGTYDLVTRAADITAKPLVLSHTSLSRRPGSRSRLISAAHARIIAGTGGIVGIWPPSSIYPDMAAFAGGIARMVDTIGIDHVALGTDMLGLVGPSTFDSYADLPDLCAALLAHGFDAAEVRKLLGGNYVRVFTASMA